MGPVERRYWFLAAAVLAIVSAAILTALDSAEIIPSVIRNPLSGFVEPGVSVRWFVLGGPFVLASSPAGIAFAAGRNFGVAVAGGIVRRSSRARNPKANSHAKSKISRRRSSPLKRRSGRSRHNYPEPFASRMAGRRKQPLGDLFGLANFGVNLTRLAPGAVSALRHAHTKQDEFV